MEDDPMSMPLAHILPAVHSRMVAAVSNRRLEEFERDALLLAFTNALRQAVVRTGGDASQLLTADRFASENLTRHEIVSAMAAAIQRGHDVASATLLLIEARVDIAIDTCGTVTFVGIGSFSRAI